MAGDPDERKTDSPMLRSDYSGFAQLPSQSQSQVCAQEVSADGSSMIPILEWQRARRPLQHPQTNPWRKPLTNLLGMRKFKLPRQPMTASRSRLGRLLRRRSASRIYILLLLAVFSLFIWPRAGSISNLVPEKSLRGRGFLTSWLRPSRIKPEADPVLAGRRTEQPRWNFDVLSVSGDPAGPEAARRSVGTPRSDIRAGRVPAAMAEF